MNPNAQNIQAQVNDLVKANGGNPEKAFRSKCAEMGIDPEPLITMLQRNCK